MKMTRIFDVIPRFPSRFPRPRLRTVSPAHSRYNALARMRSIAAGLDIGHALLLSGRAGIK